MAKTTILIFVAGAKELREQRLRLKSLSNDITSHYVKQGRDVVVCMDSYENFGERQEEYNDFIENKADIVFFVLDGKIGHKTEEEYKIASKKKNKDGVPKVVVFLKYFTKEEKTPNIEKIETLINTASDDYYVTYDNTEDLVAKAKDKVYSYVDQLLEESEKELSAQKRKFTLLSRIFGVLFLILASFGVYYLLSPKDPVLIFEGGGSTYSFIKHMFPEIGDLHSYDDTECLAIDIPSGSSYSLIGEEIQKAHGWTEVIKKEMPELNTPYYPISLSAQKAKACDFTEFSGIESKGKILSLYLGRDTLVVYVSKELISNTKSKGVISVSELANALKNDKKFTLYTTRPNSGTLNSYMKPLREYNIEINEHTLIIDTLRHNVTIGWFNDLSSFPTMASNAENSFVIFAAQYFKPKNIPDNPADLNKENMLKFYVVYDSEETAGAPKYIIRDFYLYFAGYYSAEGNICNLWFPTNMIDLLKKFNRGYETMFEGNRIRDIGQTNKDKKILDIDELKQFKDRSKEEN